MDKKTFSIFSRSLYVAGKGKESKLSLSCKRNNESDGSFDSISIGKHESSQSLENEPTSSHVQRCNSTEMKEFLGKFQNPKISRKRSSNRFGRRSVNKVNNDGRGKSDASLEDASSDFKKPQFPESSITNNAISEKESEKVETLSTTESSMNLIVTEGISKQAQEETTISNQTESDVRESNLLICPLCWKPFDSKDAQTTHMKSCAAKNNVSTKQLLELLELIQKQEDERKALGIPFLRPMTVKRVKKDSLVTSIKPKSKLDGNIQLGIALSVSLQEAERQKERDHLLEAGLFEEVKERGLLPEQEVDKENLVSTAPIFLNGGKKSSNTAIAVPRGRKKFSKFEGRIPTLMKRTPEERERLITEKVAIILVGDEQFQTADDKDSSPLWGIRSRILNNYMDEEHIFWKMAGLSPSSSSKDQFYVDSLSKFISPCKVAAGSKLKHLSQIPGRNSTPKVKDPSVKLPDFKKFEEEFLSSCVSMDKVSDNSIVVDNSKNEKKETKRILFAESPLSSQQNTLSRDWIVLVGNPEMSDVNVYTESERVIPAHKLVFFARCPLIVKDLVEEDRGGKKNNMLLWIEICYGAAFLFLKYIYGGVYSKSEAKTDKVSEDLRTLAERYEVRELIELLKRVSHSEEELADSMQDIEEKEINACEEIPFKNEESEKGMIDEHSLMKDTNISISDNIDSVSPYPQSIREGHIYVCNENDTSVREVEDNDACSKSEIDYEDNPQINSLSDSVIVNNVSRGSPDIFQTTGIDNSPESVEIIGDEEPPITQELSQSSRESIDYLVSLMEKDSINKSKECDADEDDQDKAQKFEFTSANFTDSPIVFKNNVSCSMDDTVPPKTPNLDIVAKYLVTASTPVTQLNKHHEIINKDGVTLTSEVKRKLESLDKSDLISPSPKKIRIEEKEEEKNNGREIVDLTGSDLEEDVETKPLNDSNCSTLPPPVIDREELSPSKDAVPSSPAASPCGGYISNVWDDFDYIPDVPNVDLNSSVIASQKNFTNEKENEEACDNNLIVTNTDIPNETPGMGSSQINDSPDSIILLDETTTEKPVLSSVVSTKDCSGIQEKETDITEKLLDASLSQINESVFWRDENEPKEEEQEAVSAAPCNTPIRPVLKSLGSKNDTPCTPAYIKKINVTPLADYSAMKTPMLHKELDRYGIKHLKRNQAKKLLRHIYNELHPVVSNENEKINSDSTSRDKEEPSVSLEKAISGKNVAEKRKITFENADSSPEDKHSSSDESSDNDSDFEVLEESMHESQFESPIKSQAVSHKGPYVDIPTAMKMLLESDADFHRKILLYEPIWLADIKAALKAHGAKFNVKQLMDYLDEQCITFRIEQGNRQRRRRTKKTFSLTQPCNQKRKKVQPFSLSQPS